MFWFLLFNSFDATYLFQYTFMLLYNLVFTSLPVGMLGAFDQDTNAVASMAFPQLYKRGILGLDYTRRRFWLYMLDGLYQSAIIFFIPYLVYWDGTTWSGTGRDTNGLYDFSSCVAAAGVTAANLYVGINTRYWTIIPAVVIPLSTLTVFIWIVIYSYMAALDYYAVVEIIFPTFTFWATVVFTVSLAVGPHWLLLAFRQSYLYRDKDIIREAWVGGDLKDQLGVAHRKKRPRQHDTEHAPQYPHYSKHSDLEPPLDSPRKGQADPLLMTGFARDSGPNSPISPMERQQIPPPLILHDPPRPEQDHMHSGGSPQDWAMPRSRFESGPYNSAAYSSTGSVDDPITSPQRARFPSGRTAAQTSYTSFGSIGGSGPPSRNQSNSDLRGLSPSYGAPPSSFPTAHTLHPSSPLHHDQGTEQLAPQTTDFTASTKWQRPPSEFDETYAGVAM